MNRSNFNSFYFLGRDVMYFIFSFIHLPIRDLIFSEFMIIPKLVEKDGTVLTHVKT